MDNLEAKIELLSKKLDELTEEFKNFKDKMYDERQELLDRIDVLEG